MKKISKLKIKNKKIIIFSFLMNIYIYSYMYLFIVTCIYMYIHRLLVCFGKTVVLTSLNMAHLQNMNMIYKYIYMVTMKRRNCLQIID